MTGNYTDRRLETVFKLYSDFPVTAENTGIWKSSISFWCTSIRTHPSTFILTIMSCAVVITLLNIFPAHRHISKHSTVLLKQVSTQMHRHTNEVKAAPAKWFLV